MADGVEAELKVAVDAAGVRQVGRLVSLAGFEVTARGDRRLVSTYFDTPDLALRAEGVSLRLRRAGRTGEQTVKFSGRLSLGLSERPEHNVPQPGRLPDVTLFPETAAAELTRLIDGRPLVPLFSMRVTRRRWDIVTPSGGRVEMALDRGRVTAGSRGADIREVEFELVAGERQALFEVAKAALDGVSFHFSMRAKSDFGYLLLDREVEAPQPVTATAVPLDETMTVEMAMQAVLRSCAAQVSANLAAVRAGDDAEGPHQLRVGLRRLRSALKLFSPVIAPEAADSLAEEARWLAAEVAGLRDVDVLIDELVAPLGAGTLALHETLDRRRRLAREHLAASLSDRRTGAFLIDLVAFAEGRGWLSDTDVGQSARLAAPVAPFAEAAIGRLRRRAAKLGRDPQALSATELHDLRKRIKRLRYAYDFFESLLARSLRRKLLPRVKAAQDVLGVLNDIHMARQMLGDINPTKARGAEIERAVGYCLGWHDARARAIWDRHADDISLD